MIRSTASSCYGKLATEVFTLPTLVFFFTINLASFHSRPSKPINPRITTQLEQHFRDPPIPKVSNVKDAFKLFDEMLQRRPLPSIVRFNQMLGQLVKMKHCFEVIGLYKQMGLRRESILIFILYSKYHH
ncbi:hypothetical protein RchiOBHm_Chr5g0062161 [Rosa chinensis]|uniref:Uncharacterized protein n=1 Tax=Rosa chinensis TaxID=74649 RepID=A0A2P6QI38_ROSCH|nr:hypothetical protein RchiOBHm_Chr5g0062161 [Rosa chinensis]